MEAEFEIDENGNITKIIFPEKIFSSVINKYAEIRFTELRIEIEKDFYKKLENLDIKIEKLSQLIIESKKLATESRGFNQKGITDNKKKIDNIINSLKKGIKLKLK